MKKLLIICMCVLTLGANELIIKESPYTVDESTVKFVTELKRNGLVVFDIIDHQQNANEVKMSLEEAKLIIFGNPKAGTILMQENIFSGLDLPLKVLVFKDKSGKTLITYRNGDTFRKTHLISNEPLISKIENTLTNIVTNIIK